MYPSTKKVYMGMCSIIFYGKQAKKDGRHCVLVEQKCTSFSGLKGKTPRKREREKEEQKRRRRRRRKKDIDQFELDFWNLNSIL